MSLAFADEGTISIPSILVDVIAQEIAPVQPILNDVIAQEITPIQPILSDFIAQEMITAKLILSDAIAQEITAVKPILSDTIAQEVTAVKPLLSDVIAQEVIAVKTILSDYIAQEIVTAPPPTPPPTPPSQILCPEFADILSQEGYSWDKAIASLLCGLEAVLTELGNEISRSAKTVSIVFIGIGFGYALMRVGEKIIMLILRGLRKSYEKKR
jgi:hypothetical protein